MSDAAGQLSGRLHTRLRDRVAIAHPYDLSNEFYELLLDEHMAYSSAYFEHPDQSLHEAQTAKLDLVCRKRNLQPGQRLRDIGCGWGSMILHSARNYGVHATGITLSVEQRYFNTERVARLSLSESVELRLQDYRESDAEKEFDAVSSIDKMYRALKPGGSRLLQQMSRRAYAAPGGGAFIESYIAPDMHMRPLWQTLKYVQDSGFEVRDVGAILKGCIRKLAARGADRCAVPGTAQRPKISVAFSRSLCLGAEKEVANLADRNQHRGRLIAGQVVIGPRM